MSVDQSQQPNRFFTWASPRQRLIAAVLLFLIVGSFAGLWLIARYEIPIYPYGCGFKQRYGLPCPTCGMTHAVLAFAQGHIIRSFYTQPAAALFCSLAVVVAFLAFLTAVFGIYFPSFQRWLSSLKLRYILAAILLVLAAGWAVTLARALAQRGQY